MRVKQKAGRRQEARREGRRWGIVHRLGESRRFREEAADED